MATGAEAAFNSMKSVERYNKIVDKEPQVQSETLLSGGLCEFLFVSLFVGTSFWVGKKLYEYSSEGMNIHNNEKEKED